MRLLKDINLFAIVFISIILSVLHSSEVYAKTPQEIARKAFASVVLLVMEDANGQPLSLGSGFFVGSGQIASNLHVIEGASRGYAKVVGQKTKYNIEGTVGIDSGRDLVILKISSLSTPTLNIGNSDAVEVGAPVYVVGNPQGLEGTFSQGIVSSIRDVGSNKLLQITAPISPGSSGGPVLDSNGKVIGVSVATFRGGQNLNFAIPANYLKKLMSTTGTSKPLAGLRVSKTQRSIFADLGGRSTDGVVSGQLIWDYPNNPYLGMGGYSFSIRNRLRENAKNIYCLVVFYDSTRNPIDVDIVRYRGVIPAGLAKRVKSSVDVSVKNLSRNKGSIEFRILDFQLTD